MYLIPESLLNAHTSLLLEVGSYSSLLLSQLSTPTPIIGVEYYSLTPRLYYQGLPTPAAGRY